MRNYLFFLFTCTLLFFQVRQAQAQRFEPGLGLGAVSYTGDVTPSLHPSSLGGGGEIFLRYNLSPVVNLRANAMFAFTDAEDSALPDAFQQIRDVSFQSNILEASLRLEYNFRDFRKRTELRRMSPYVFFGGGIAQIRTEGNYADKTLSTVPVLPFGAGIKLAMPYNFNLGVELGARKVFSDEVDALNPDLLTTKFQSVNPHNSDMYYFLGISLSYTYDVGGICPIRFQ